MLPLRAALQAAALLLSYKAMLLMEHPRRNRTPVGNLQNYCSTIELREHNATKKTPGVGSGAA